MTFINRILPQFNFIEKYADPEKKKHTFANFMFILMQILFLYAFYLFISSILYYIIYIIINVILKPIIGTKLRKSLLKIIDLVWQLLQYLLFGIIFIAIMSDFIKN